MANDNLKAAIDEVIKPNDKKAITAESLANLLKMMVDEGTGTGALDIKMGTLSLLDLGGDSKMFSTVLSAEEKAHNQEVFRTIKEASETESAVPPITIDFGPMIKNLISLIGGEEGALINSYIQGLSLVFNNIIYGYVNSPLLSMAELGLGSSEIVFSYALIVLIILKEDGSVLLVNSGLIS